MILTNFVSFVGGHILMLGTWFDPENNNYSNEVHTRNADVVKKHDGPVYAEWELDYLTFTHYRDRE
tara:strand:+ start:303 stop:500 length:198 start_codon:yes stop_codon:yes gene_type:complete